MKHIRMRKLRPKLRKLKRRAAERKELLGAHASLFARTLSALLAAEDVPVLYDGSFPVGERMASLDELTDESVTAALSALMTELPLCGSDIESFAEQTAAVLAEKGIAVPEKAEYYAEKLYALGELDRERIIARVNPLCELLENDPAYTASDADTQKNYRRAVTEISFETGIDENRLAFEYRTNAEKSGRDIGGLIMADYRRVFPFVRQKRYIIMNVLLSVLLAVLFLPVSGALFPLTLIPALAVVKTAADRICAVSVKGGSFIPQIKREEIKGTALCVLSALVDGEGTLSEAVYRLSEARARNGTEKIKYCLLCDLPAADYPEVREDEAVVAAIRAYSEREDAPIFILRRRTFSETQGKYQGADRKRGAVEELVRYLTDGTHCFREILGEAGKPDYLMLLDFDTLPLMDTIPALCAAAEHPLNRKYGVFVPRVSSTLTSCLKTTFSRIMGGNGGCFTASLYDSFSGELYFDCFGEGIFTGKGLVRVKDFYEKCCGAFRAETVLSHDILEGGLLGTAYVGTVEASDSFPAAPRAYFRRQHRWIRGDFQNARFILDRRFSPLTRWKLFDNIRRALTPAGALALCVGAAAVGSGALFAAALLSLVFPFVFAFLPLAAKGFSFMENRRFYAPIRSNVSLLLSQAAAELALAAKNTETALDAAVRTLWRTCVSKKKLLEWTTASALDRAGGSRTEMLGSLPYAAVLLAVALISGFVPCVVYGAVLMSAPLLVRFADRERRPKSGGLSQADADMLKTQAEKMWSFYADNVSRDTNYLPPDNVQYAPVFRVCPNTSPTNIGMYLLSCVCADRLGIIDTDEAAERIEQTLGTLEKLKKYHGNLFNWYDIHTLGTVSPFVSSVDSGNLLCCLATVGTYAAEKGLHALAGRTEKLADGTDLKIFYNRNRRLFSVGINSDTGEKMPNCYDLLMSESRMMSYYAIAAGQAPKSHWRALGRTASRADGYSGCVSWTGTMFEFFMPSLLLFTREGSIAYEAVSFALRCQLAEKYGGVMGKSESGYYAFDNALNYQYKAHGVQKNALCGGMGGEWVVSPYSSYIAMPFAPSECVKNLEKMKKYGAEHEKYGFYEALDFTPERTGGGYAIVKSHMAHHVGMSLAGVTNTLCGFELCRLFGENAKMKRADELLEERALTGLLAVNSEPEHEKGGNEAMTEEIKDISVISPRINMMSNGILNIYAADNGLCCGRINGKSTYVKTETPERPHGAFFGFADGGNVLSFAKRRDDSPKTERCTEFSQNATTYYVNLGGICAGMRHSVDDELAAEYRVFAAENISGVQKKLTLCAYIEPALADDAEISAHRAFAQMFLRVRYDEEKKLFLASRKERDSGRETVMCAGFIGDEDFTYCLGREEACVPNKPFGFFDRAAERKNSSSAVPEPCIFIRADMTVDSGETRTSSFFVCYAESEKTVLAMAEQIRRNGVPDSAAAENTSHERITAPLVRSSLAGRIAAKILPSVLYGFSPSEEILKACSLNTLPRSRLGRYGIPCDRPFVLCAGEEKAYETAVQALCRGGVPCALVVRGEGENTDCVRYVPENALSVDEEILLRAASAYICGYDDERADEDFLPIRRSLPPKNPAKQGFDAKGYTVTQKKLPHCTVLANPSFGTLVSQNSLGFTWAINSRENKLTPWYNDILHDNDGERLFLHGKGCLTDILSGAEVHFGSNSAVWRSRCQTDVKGGEIDIKTTVGVAEKGMAKQVVLELYSEKQQTAEISYLVSPVQGAGMSDSGGGKMIRCFAEGNAAVTVNPCSLYGGAVAVTADVKCTHTGDKAAFMRGETGGLTDVPQSFANPCAAVTVKLILPPKRREKIRFILSYTRNGSSPLSMPLAVNSQRFSAPVVTENKISCGSKDSDVFANVFLPWQVLGCRMWARTGFYQNGGAYGFRDQLQDALAAISFRPEECMRQIYRCCASQFAEGDVLHWWHYFPDGRKGARTRCSDDMLWLPFVTAEYVRRTGDTEILHKEIRYCRGEPLSENEREKYISVTTDGEKADVYSHCKAALDRGFSVGMHGMLKIGSGDWNDGYNEVGANGVGVSVWLSMFYVMTARKFMYTAKKYGDNLYAAELQLRIAQLETAIDENGWDGDYYVRAFYDNGEKMGSRESVQCKTDLLPQAFSVLAELPDRERARRALAFARSQLTDSKNRIVRLFAPAFDRSETHERAGYVMSYPVGVRENGGQYTHAAVWLALAFLRIGDKEYAKRLSEMLMPFGRDEHYKNEPYYLSADIYTNPDAFGRGGWSLYTGSAGWLYQLLEELFGG